tara:strand:+ start:13253 stop:14224 length:972 start_codon:yes stop_codon:yes gene_type:complete
LHVQGDSFLIRQIFAISLATIVTGCVTNQGLTDAGGRSMSLEAKGPFSPADSRFNAFVFLEPSKDYSTDAYERDNGRAWSEVIAWDGKYSFFDIQLNTDAWYAQSTEARMLDKSQFIKLANKFGIPESNFTEIDQVSPRIKGWIASKGDCSIGRFAKRMKGLSAYDNDRGLSDSVVQFGTCSHLIASAETIAQKIDLITKTEKAELAQKYAKIGPLSAISLSKKPAPELHFNASWDGVSDNISGDVEQKGAAQTSFKFHINEQDTDCEGTSVTATSSKSTGRWKFTCENGLSATGIWQKKPDGKTTGSGFDAQKREIKFNLTS